MARCGDCGKADPIKSVSGFSFLVSRSRPSQRSTTIWTSSLEFNVTLQIDRSEALIPRRLAQFNIATQKGAISRPLVAPYESGCQLKRVGGSEFVTSNLVLRQLP
jgi:hypothetical protein